MQFELAHDEIVVLRNVLTHYLSELRMEIAGTERLAWRQAMHREEDVIKELLERLPEPEATAAGGREAGP